MTIHLFQVCPEDVIAAETLDEAIEWYTKVYDMDEWYDPIESNAHQIPDEALDTRMIRLDDYDDELDQERIIRKPFREHLDNLIAEGVTFPVLFSSTEY